MIFYGDQHLFFQDNHIYIDIALLSNSFLFKNSEFKKNSSLRSLSVLSGRKDATNYHYFNFELFIEKYQILKKDSTISQLSFSWLTWFIGFAEGDGSFIVAKRGDIYFVITQDTRDIQILYMIKEVLGFGNVIKQSNTTSRYVVQDKKGLYLISLLFNGNLVSRNKHISYKLFNKSINEYSKKGKIVLNTIVYNPLLVKPSLEDS